MHRLQLFLVVPILAIPIALWHCKGPDTGTPPGDDAGYSSDDDDANGDDSLLGDDAGPTINCELSNPSSPSNTPTDPVSLCVQKAVLEAVHHAAWSSAGGLAAEWDSASLQPITDGGAVLHDWRDDAAFGSAITDYLIYAVKYGDNEIDADISNVLVEVSTVLEAELATPPDDYDGEPYRLLRNVEAGLNTINETTHAQAIDAIANAYGNAIATTYLHPLGGGDMIVGRCASPGVCTYESAKAASAAYALLDLAWRATFTDAGIPLEASAPAALTTDATAILDHLAHNAASPSGMYYRALVTGSGGDGGAPDGGAGGGDVPVVLDQWPADALLTDVQAVTIDSLVRAVDLVNTQSALSAVANYPFYDEAEAIYTGMHGSPSLWDATLGGYFEAYVPSTGALYTNKPIYGNGVMYGALAYKFLEEPPPGDAGPTQESVELDSERTLLTQNEMMDSSFFSQLGTQSAYFAATSASFGLAVAYGPDAGSTGTAAGASNYVARATNAVLAGMSAQAYGVVELQ